MARPRCGGDFALDPREPVWGRGEVTEEVGGDDAGVEGAGVEAGDGEAGDLAGGVAAVEERLDCVVGASFAAAFSLGDGAADEEEEAEAGVEGFDAGGGGEPPGGEESKRGGGLLD